MDQKDKILDVKKMETTAIPSGWSRISKNFRKHWSICMSLGGNSALCQIPM